MRFVVRVLIPTEAGNKMVTDPNFIQNIEGFIKNTKAEAAYFRDKRDRTAVFIVDIASTEGPCDCRTVFHDGGKSRIPPCNAT
jgi:siroheme synthase (precorrin-2 oxidase/ferrochelatase)